MFIFERERDRAQAEEGQREGETENQSKTGSRLCSTEPYAGLKSTICEIVIRAKVVRLT